VIDRSRPIDAGEDALIGGTAARRRLVVLNKRDLPDGSAGAAGRLARHCDSIEVSALDGSGIDDLRRRVAEILGGGPELAGLSHEEAMITSLRQRDLLQRAATSLRGAETAARSGAGDEFWLIDLREAIDRLGEITGAVSIDDLHDKIFSTFCIGK
jgi:tRNA modification GTPase